MASIEREREATQAEMRASPDMDGIDVALAEDATAREVEAEPASERRHGSAA